MIVTALVAGLAGGSLCEAAEIQPRHSKDDGRIHAVMSAQAAAWNRGAIDGFMNGYARSDATEFIARDTLTRGWQTVRDRYKKKYDRPQEDGYAHFLGVESHIPGRSRRACDWTLKAGPPEGQAARTFHAAFRRTPEGWGIVHDHTSAAEPR